MFSSSGSAEFEALEHAFYAGKLIKVDEMTGHSGQKGLNSPILDSLGERAPDGALRQRLNGQAVADHAALVEGSPNLENILGKISAIMADDLPDPGAVTAQRGDASGYRSIGAGFEGEQSIKDGFVAREPVDLLAPYSDVLGEVRDYFKDKHSLGPNDSLLKSQNLSFGEQGSVLGAAGGSDFGSDGVLRDASADAFATEALSPSTLSADVYSSGASLNGGNVFSPMNLPSAMPEVLAPEQREIQSYGRELMGRMSHLEQVIGHHFSDQTAMVKEVAQEASKAAVELALKNLPDTQIGRRLDELELAFAQMKQAQGNGAAAPQKLAAAPQKLAAAFDRVVAAPQKPVVAPERVAVVPEKQVAAAVRVPPVMDKSVKAADQTAAIQTQKQPPTTKKVGLTEQQVSLTAHLERVNAGASQVGQQPAVKEVTGSIKTSDGGILPIPEGVKSTGAPIAGQGAALNDLQANLASLDKDIANGVEGRPPVTEANLDDDRASMDQLRKIFSSEDDKKPFGNQTASKETSTPDEGADPFVTKSSDLRERFNRSKIMSNDNDLNYMQRRGARPAFIIITLALILAAIGLSFGKKSFDVVSWARTTLQNQGIINAEKTSRTGLGDATKHKGAMEKPGSDHSTLKNEDLSITGNILLRGEDASDGKIDRRLSDKKGQGVKTAALVQVSGKLALPEALIGPYSLRHAAANGDVASQFEVARRFGLGQGVPRDYEKAVLWFMQAASKDFAPAQYRLATFYERGRGVVRDLKAAQKWYKRAANLGNVKAMHNLAVVSTSINPDKPDYQTAIYWFKQAASRNLADSQFNLAILYQNGVGLTQNYPEAYRWFALAARQGDLDAAIRRDGLEKKLKKGQLLMVHNMLQSWKPIVLDDKANHVGIKGAHIVSTMSHAKETVKRSRVLTAQILLRRLGYKVKDADGTMNDPTVAAIKKFEKDKGMPITGGVTSDLINVLNKVAL